MLPMLNRALACAAAIALSAPSPAYLYWSRPAAKGAPVNGDEAGIALPMPGATPRELRAGLLWSMRAGLNVAALQCQFAPELRTVELYNQILRQHGAELQDAYATVGAYYARILTPASSTPAPSKGKAKAKPKAAKADQKAAIAAAEAFNTRTYNSFSTLRAQFTFCDTAAAIGRDALALPPGRLGDLAALRMREFRNSLVPVGDAALDTRPGGFDLDPLPPVPCVDRKGRIVKCKTPKA